MCILGACNTDYSFYVRKFPAVGETLHAQSFKKAFGGKGANQAVMAARLGASAHFISAVGEDPDGVETIKNLRNNNIDATHVSVIPNMYTGIAHIIVDQNGSNEIVISVGANNFISTNDVDKAWEHVKHCKVYVAQLETPLEATLALFRLVRQHRQTESSCCVIFNPAPAQADLPKEVFTHSDIVCPNETEAALLTGITINSVQDAHLSAVKLQEMGANTVVITLGDKGCFVLEKGSKEGKHIQPCKVDRVVDTTGSGDAFCGSLAFFLAQGDSLVQALEKSNQVAAISVTALGTQTSFPSRHTLPQTLFA